MDYNRFGKILDTFGFSQDPAITDPRLLVRIGTLPEEYRQQALGLYYPECPEDPSMSRLWVPADADDETVKHEIGHRIGHYYRDDVSEPFAERFRKSVMEGAVMRRAPAKQGITEISSLTISPSSPLPGDTVNVNLIISNNYSSAVSVMGALYLVVNNQAMAINYSTPTSGTLDPQGQIIIAASFIMPSENCTLNAQSIYYGSDSQWHLDQTQILQLTVSGGGVQPITGQISKVEILFNGEPANSVPPGATFDLRVSFLAFNPGGGLWGVCVTAVGMNDTTIQAAGYADTGIIPGNYLGQTGPDGHVFPLYVRGLVAKASVDSLRIILWGNPYRNTTLPVQNSWRSGQNPGNQWQIVDSGLQALVIGVPSSYPCVQDTKFAEMATYQGEYVECTWSLSAQNFPGTSWIVDDVINACLNNQTQDAKILELKIFQKPTQVYNDFGYLVPSSNLGVVVQMSLRPTVATLRNPAMLTDVVISAIIRAATIIIVAISAVIIIWRLTKGPDIATTKTTVTTPPTTTNVPSGGTVVVGTGDTAVVTGGPAGDTTVTPPGGSTVTVPPGTKATVGPGSTIKTGSGSAIVTNPGTTSTTESQQPVPNSFDNLIKGVVIAACVVGGAAVLVAGFQAFGKREIYPVKR